MLYTPAKLEIELSKLLQNAVRKRIAKNEWNGEDLAQKLDLLPVGVEDLLEQKSWSIDTAMRVASALEIPLSFKICNV